MASARQEYDNLMADLCLKGFGGIVAEIDPDYKNIHEVPPQTWTYTTSKTKNAVDAPTYTPNPKTKNERAAAGQAAALPPLNYDEEIYLILNKTPYQTAGHLQKALGNKHHVTESLRKLREHGLIDYDDYFRFYPKGVS